MDQRLRSNVVRAKTFGLFWILVFPTTFFAFGFGLAGGALYSDLTWGGPLHLADLLRGLFLAVAAVFSGAIVIFGAKTAWNYLWSKPRLVLYFREALAVEHESDFSLRGGFGLAAVISSLDRVAELRGARALSDFGFADDQFGERLIWHDAAEGVRTVEALLSALRGGDAPSPCKLAERDLETVSEALRRAANLGTPFCLLVRVGDDSWQGLGGLGRVGRFW